MSESSPKFVHRALPNGAFETFCTQCHRTIAVLWMEAYLQISEVDHVCEEPVVIPNLALVRAIVFAPMDETEERRLMVENLRTRLELLESERSVLLRELATVALPAEARAQKLQRRAGLQRGCVETMKALRDLGEPD